MRIFNRQQRQELFIRAKGLCQQCHTPLPKGWHADHVIPYSKGGETTIENGQALCAKCNLLKSNHMQNIQLRDWQAEFYQLPFKQFMDSIYDTSIPNHFLLHAGVGSGKTYGSIIASKPFIEHGWNIVICSPSDNVKASWANAFHTVLRKDIDSKFQYTNDFRRDFIGVSVTFHSLNKNNVRFLSKLINKKTLLILDEVHHLAETKSWGDAIQEIGELCGFVLSLTGTPFRHDNEKIPYASYLPYDGTERWQLNTDYSYSYAQSVADKVCCPVSFRRIQIVSPNFDRDNELLMENIEAHKLLFSDSLRPDQPYIKKIIDAADNQLNDKRQMMPNAAGLIVCSNIDSAKLIQQTLPNSMVITSDVNDSSDIDKFRNGNYKWLVSVQMISEGVDIPRVRVIVYLHNITTRLFFEQVMGRAIRNRNDANGLDHAYFFYPNYSPLHAHALDIENSITHIREEQEQEENETDYGDYTRNSNPRSTFYIADAGEEHIYNLGYDISDIKILLANSNLPVEHHGTIERSFAELIQQRNNNSTHKHIVAIPPKKTDRIEELRSEIKKSCYKVLMQRKLPQNLIGLVVREFNLKAFNKEKSTDATEEELLRKLHLLKTELNNGN